MKLFKYLSALRYMRNAEKKLSGAKRPFISISMRYLILAAVAFPNLYIFYLIFTPLTAYPSYFALKLFFDASLVNGTIIKIGSSVIELIEACIAGSAYYLLLILNLSTPGIRPLKRTVMILLSFAFFLLINLSRIIFLSFLFIFDSAWFDISHKVFWYFGSSIFVIIIWFANVKIFAIKDIPVYSDIKFLWKEAMKRN